jgi:hypothetical protein
MSITFSSILFSNAETTVITEDPLTITSATTPVRDLSKALPMCFGRPEKVPAASLHAWSCTTGSDPFEINTVKSFNVKSSDFLPVNQLVRIEMTGGAGETTDGITHSFDRKIQYVGRFTQATADMDNLEYTFTLDGNYGNNPIHKVFGTEIGSISMGCAAGDGTKAWMDTTSLATFKSWGKEVTNRIFEVAFKGGTYPFQTALVEYNCPCPGTGGAWGFNGYYNFCTQSIVGNTVSESDPKTHSIAISYIGGNYWLDSTFYEANPLYWTGKTPPTGMPTDIGAYSQDGLTMFQLGAGHPAKHSLVSDETGTMAGCFGGIGKARNYIYPGGGSWEYNESTCNPDPGCGLKSITWHYPGVSFPLECKTMGWVAPNTSIQILGVEGAGNVQGIEYIANIFNSYLDTTGNNRLIVYAEKNGDLTEVPTSWYTTSVGTFVLPYTGTVALDTDPNNTPLTATKIILNTPISYHSNDTDTWGDQLYVTLTSKFGGNTNYLGMLTDDLINAISTRYYELTIAGSTNLATTYRANYAKFGTYSLRTMLNEIAYQTGSVIYPTYQSGSRVMKIRSIWHESSTEQGVRLTRDQITISNILVKSFKEGVKDVTELAKKLTATWQPNYYPKDKQGVTVKVTGNSHGQDETADIYMYKSSVPVKAVAAFWLQRKSTNYIEVEFSTTYESTAIEILEMYQLVLPYFSNWVLITEKKISSMDGKISFKGLIVPEAFYS